MVSWMTFLLAVWVTLSWQASAPEDGVAWYWVYSRSSAKSVLDLRAPQVTGHEVVYSTPAERPWVRLEVDAERINYFWVTSVTATGGQSEPSRMIFVIFEDASRAAVEPIPWLSWMKHPF